MGDRRFGSPQILHIMGDGTRREDIAGYQPPVGFSDSACRLFQELAKEGEELGENTQNNRE